LLIIEYFANIEKMLDMLIEFVQGPCEDNQLTLIEGSFLEIAYEILSLELNEKSYLVDPRSTGFEPWKVARVKNRCMILLLSLLEGNISQKIAFKLRQFIPEEILQENLSIAFRNHIKLYGLNYPQEALNHVKLI